MKLKLFNLLNLNINLQINSIKIIQLIHFSMYETLMIPLKRIQLKRSCSLLLVLIVFFLSFFVEQSSDVRVDLRWVTWTTFSRWATTSVWLMRWARRRWRDPFCSQVSCTNVGWPPTITVNRTPVPKSSTALPPITNGFATRSSSIPTATVYIPSHCLIILLRSFWFLFPKKIQGFVKILVFRSFFCQHFWLLGQFRFYTTKFEKLFVY